MRSDAIESTTKKKGLHAVVSQEFLNTGSEKQQRPQWGVDALGQAPGNYEITSDTH